MEPLQAPEGDVVATHPATLFGRVLAVLMMVLPGAAMVWFGTQVSGSDADARMPLLAGGGALIALGVLAIVQQNRSKVVVRTDGIERWGLRGRLWALRWAEMAELRYRAVKMRLYHVIPVGTNIYLTLTDPQGRKRRLPSNMKGMDVLAERVADQQTAARFAEARAAIDRGEEVRFGKAIVLDREKVSVRKLFGGYKSCALPESEEGVVEAGGPGLPQRARGRAVRGWGVGGRPHTVRFAPA